jgi:hypothetical protein
LIIKKLFYIFNRFMSSWVFNLIINSDQHKCRIFCGTSWPEYESTVRQSTAQQTTADIAYQVQV